jgi:predicted ferric reductase
MAGAFLGVVGRPWAAAVEQAVMHSLFGADHSVYAQLSRASGLAAYALVWLALTLGLLLSGRVARTWPGQVEAYELHRYSALLGLSFTLFHVFVLVGDPRMSGEPALLLVPFGILPIAPWSWWGQFAFYGLILAAASFYARRFIGKKVWKVVHTLSIAFYIMALVHAFGAGDAGANLALSSFYWVTGGSAGLLGVYRLATTLLGQRRKQGQRARKAKAA